MPSEEFPQQKQKELTQEQWERVLEVKIDPTESIKDIIDYLKNSGTIRFIITDDFDIFFSTEIHRILVKRLGISLGNCLLPDGQITCGSAPQEEPFYFRYSWGMSSDKYQHRDKNLYVAAENKIKEFLKSQGIEIL